MHPEVGLLLTAWKDIDRILDDIALDDLIDQISSGRSFARTLDHVTYDKALSSGVTFTDNWRTKSSLCRCFVAVLADDLTRPANAR